MGKKLAIVIGISNYDKEICLEACEHDADNMMKLLESTGKYDDMLSIYTGGNVTSDDLKNQIPDFIAKHEKEDIEELFFYYSGHGSLIGEEFVYIPSNYDYKRPNQTTCKNSDVDNMLRTLKAELTIKVIDACHCGVDYVKDTNGYHKAIDSSKKSFKKCYFFFSSHNNQTSETDDKMGYFTKSFFEAVMMKPQPKVKYTDIADYISDDFEGNAEQTPFFISQGNYTELFCEKDKALEDTLNSILNGKSTSTSSAKTEDAESPLLRAIIKDEKNYRSVEAIATIINSFKDTIGQTTIESDIEGIFDVVYEFEEGLESFKQKSEVGEWLKANKNRYKARYETSNMLDSGSLTSFGLSIPENDPIKELSFLKSMPRTYVSGFDVEVKLPYQVIIVRFKSKHQNVDDYVGFITFLYSNISLRYFYNLGVCTSNKYRPVQCVSSLATIDCKYAEEKSVEHGLNSILLQLQKELISLLSKKFVDSSTGVK